MANEEQPTSDAQSFSMFMGAVSLMLFVVPAASTKIDFCPLNIGLLERLPHFEQLVRSGLVGSTQVCLFGNMLVPFWAIAICGCIYFRSYLKQLAIEAQRRQNMPNPGSGQAFNIMLWLSIICGIFIFVAQFVPVSMLMGGFATKQFSLEAFLLCGEGLLIALTLAYA
ncbi:hypothetical protein [Methylosinus sp. LW4]|uniref:hypothetical protein n=1 Tax=Methylosinus sp. LW4 TaxID=136993 RepID=UPI0012F887C5|nr:hypothetical protein [Methylosinus sp. LW4]